MDTQTECAAACGQKNSWPLVCQLHGSRRSARIDGRATEVNYCTSVLREKRREDAKCMAEVTVIAHAKHTGITEYSAWCTYVSLQHQ